jgi:hypothetical protein
LEEASKKHNAMVMKNSMTPSLFLQQSQQVPTWIQPVYWGPGIPGLKTTKTRRNGDVIINEWEIDGDMLTQLSIKEQIGSLPAQMTFQQGKNVRTKPGLKVLSRQETPNSVARSTRKR